MNFTYRISNFAKKPLQAHALDLKHAEPLPVATQKVKNDTVNNT